MPAWYYNFRVSMVTWGEPPLSCCDSSAVSFITGTTPGWEELLSFGPVVSCLRRCKSPVWPSAPEAPHVSSVDYSRGVLFVRWTYGELLIDLSHSRILHWQVLAIGKKGPEGGFSVDVSLPVRLGSAHTGGPVLGVWGDGWCVGAGDP